mmetsp:Transcript_5136/g.14597  ORF Transcript_5136/g.14597 Transcript_5136/m.14597 type:complete len:258 (+) Transcript_5136:392-1165(+)
MATTDAMPLPKIGAASLIVGVALQPPLDAHHLASGVVRGLGGRNTHEELARLVVDKDEDAERDAREPVREAQVARAEHVDGQAVAEPSGEHGLEEEAEVERGVPHALRADGQPAGLADEQVGPLHHHDGHEERALRVRERLLHGHARRDIHAHLGAGHVGIVGVRGAIGLLADLAGGVAGDGACEAARAVAVLRHEEGHVVVHGVALIREIAGVVGALVTVAEDGIPVLLLVVQLRDVRGVGPVGIEILVPTVHRGR